MDCARPLIESLCADAPAKSARAIDRLRVEFPLTPTSRKDVPHRFPNQCRLESMADDLSRVGESIIKNLLPTRFAEHIIGPPGWRARSGRRQRASHDIGKVARQTGSRLDALERALRLAAAAGFERAPSAEGGRHAGGYLGVLGVERQHNIGDEIIAGAIGAIELGRVCMRKDPD